MIFQNQHHGIKTEIKISYKCFWDDAEYFVQTHLINPLKVLGLPITIVDAYNEKCDILFISVFGEYLPRNTKGNPTIIWYTGEHKNNRETNKQFGDYFLGFDKEETSKSLYYPLWALHLSCLNKYHTQDLIMKDKFCLFMVSNKYTCKSNGRIDIFNELSKYKTVDSRGKCLNNSPMIPFSNFKEPSRYKFIICYENQQSSGNYSYITEKITNAFAYNTIPIYCGAQDVSSYFNEGAFINANNKSIEEIVDIVKEIDNDDELYNKIRREPIFASDIDYESYFKNNYIRFMEKIIFNKKEQ